MSEKKLGPRLYVAVYVALVILTLATVGLSFVHMDGESGASAGFGISWHTLVGLVIAVCKASLVALFFMHVLYSNRLTLAVILSGLVCTAILFALTLSDYLTRFWLIY